MSGPVSEEDIKPVREAPRPPGPVIEVTDSREAQVGDITVRRALPRRGRRTVGAWCFLDHMGPAPVTEERSIDVAPHPHIGLQTVTWLLSGEIVHRDSLGSEQVIRPGQLNLMTAGHGVSHSEENSNRYRGELHGVQLWVALPEATRDGSAAFEHHGSLPGVALETGEATVMVGVFAGTASPARRDTDHVGVELNLLAGSVTVPVEQGFEYGLVVLSGAVTVSGPASGAASAAEWVATAEPGRFVYLGAGRDEVSLTALEPSRAILVGGTPWPEPIVMWWNYVGRTQAEIVQAHLEWTERADRFGRVRSALAPIDVPPPPWRA